MKFWWPQCETIIASLYAYLGTGDEEYLYRHQRISEWTYAHFPDQDYPEWYGYLHRDGTVAQPAKGNIFKGQWFVMGVFYNTYYDLFSPLSTDVLTPSTHRADA